MQVAARQLVLATWYRQAPVPSQVPSWPQAVVSTAQPPLDPPPALIGLQRPLCWFVSAKAHERHRPVQLLWQQTLPTHWLFTHSLFIRQGAPSTFLAMQVLGTAVPQ